MTGGWGVQREFRGEKQERAIYTEEKVQTEEGLIMSVLQKETED